MNYSNYSYLAIFHDAHSFFGCEKCQMRETNTGTVGEMYKATHLILFIFHQCFISDSMNLAHVHVRVFMRIKYTLDGNCMYKRLVSEANATENKHQKLLHTDPVRKYLLTELRE